MFSLFTTCALILIINQLNANLNFFYLYNCRLKTRRYDLVSFVSFLHLTDHIKPIIVVVQTLKSNSSQKESNYFSFYHIIRLFSLIHTPVITNDVLREDHNLALEISLNFFRLTCEPINLRRSASV